MIQIVIYGALESIFKKYAFYSKRNEYSILNSKVNHEDFKKNKF